MQMKDFTKVFVYFSLALAVFSAAPVFAAGNLTVANGSLSPLSSSGDFWNTGMNVVLNVSLNATIGTVNVSAILVNISGTANTSNITGIFVYNDSNFNAIIDLGETLLGSNTSLNVSTNYSLVNFTTNLSVPADTKRNILVAFNISLGAFRFNTTAAQISINTSIRTSDAEVGDNITITTGSMNSTVKQILHMHANATLTPRVVDTNVSEQTFVLTVSPSSTEKINRTKILVPVGYTIVNVTDVYIGSTLQTRNFDGSVGVDQVGINLGATEFNVTTNTGGTNSAIKINFTVNTNVSAQGSTAFTTKIFSNISFIDPNVYNDELNVTTRTIIQILNVGGNKTAALMNGTDYWEFTLRLNFTTDSNTSGLLQFKMSNWTSTSGTINLTNSSSTGMATLYMSNETIFSGRHQNVTDNYNVTRGVAFNVTAETTAVGADRVKNLVLRMTIPSAAPVSTNWYSVFSILFRSNPT